MQVIWQKSYVVWLSCHSWRDLDNRSVSAMILFLVVLAALSVAGIVGSIAALRSDGLRRVAVVDSRIPDRDPAASADAAAPAAPAASNAPAAPAPRARGAVARA
jgi:hypothetical protein